VPAPRLYTTILVRLEHLQNLFFLERLLLQAGAGSEATLLDVNCELVALTLIFWTRDDRLHQLRADSQWLVMSYAAPASGILCMELLKPISGGANTVATSSSTSQYTGAVSRSTIIQNLSLLIGFLDWIRPTAPNGNLCQTVKEVIQRVLDKSLNPAAQGDDAMAGWEPDFSAEINDFFTFDLLDTFDWLRPADDAVRSDGLHISI